MVRRRRRVICVPAPKQQSCVCPAPRKRKSRQRKRRARPRRMGGGIDPFLHCVYGPVNYIGEGHRAPDGHSEPSIVVEHRSVVTITPSSNGNITFALVASPYGAIGIDEGDVTITYNNADVSTGSFPYNYLAPASTSISPTSANWSGSGDVNSHYSLVPFAEWLQVAGASIGNQARTGMQASKFRVLSSQAKVAFTGNTLYDQGVASTARLSFDFDQNLPITAPSSLSNDAYFLQYGCPLPQQLPDNFNLVAALPGSRTFPVSQSVHMINPPTGFAYQDMKGNWAPFYTSSVATQSKDVCFGGLVKTKLTSTPTFETTGNDSVFGLGFAPVTFYAATGMSTTVSQSIVVETRTCVEYTISYGSPSARFASLPPPERPIALRQAHDIGRVLPSSVATSPTLENLGFWGLLGRAAADANATFFGTVERSTKYALSHIPLINAITPASWQNTQLIPSLPGTGGYSSGLSGQMRQLQLGGPPRRLAIGY